MKNTSFYILFGIWFIYGFSFPLYAQKFDMKHSYNVQTIAVGQEGCKFIKVWAEGSSVKKAMRQAALDAVAATLFVGLPESADPFSPAASTPPLCNSINTYLEHKKYFDKFFKSGAYLHFVTNVNSQYPSGEDNLRVSNGHRVAVYLLVKYDLLRKQLEADNIIKGLNDYF